MERFPSSWNRKDVRVLVICTPDKEQEAKDAGADYVGLDEYIDKIKGGWTDVDVIITTPQVYGKGRCIGPSSRTTRTDA